MARGGDAYDRVARVLNGIGDRAQRRGVSVSLHNHVGGVFENADDFEAMAGRFDGAKAGFTVDTGHTAKAGIDDAGELIRRYRALLRNVHLKDMDAKGNFCPLGRGGVDLRCDILQVDERAVTDAAGAALVQAVRPALVVLVGDGSSAAEMVDLGAPAVRVADRQRFTVLSDGRQYAVR